MDPRTGGGSAGQRVAQVGFQGLQHGAVDLEVTGDHVAGLEVTRAAGEIRNRSAGPSSGERSTGTRGPSPEI